MPWTGAVCTWWGDERSVAADDDDRNAEARLRRPGTVRLVESGAHAGGEHPCDAGRSRGAEDRCRPPPNRPMRCWPRPPRSTSELIEQLGENPALISRCSASRGRTAHFASLFPRPRRGRDRRPARAGSQACAIRRNRRRCALTLTVPMIARSKHIRGCSPPKSVRPRGQGRLRPAQQPACPKLPTPRQVARTALAH